jgi:hypothetical protein
MQSWTGDGCAYLVLRGPVHPPSVLVYGPARLVHAIYTCYGIQTSAKGDKRVRRPGVHQEYLGPRDVLELDDRREDNHIQVAAVPQVGDVLDVPGQIYCGLFSLVGESTRVP